MEESRDEAFNLNFSSGSQTPWPGKDFCPAKSGGCPLQRIRETSGQRPGNVPAIPSPLARAVMPAAERQRPAVMPSRPSFAPKAK